MSCGASISSSLFFSFESLKLLRSGICTASILDFVGRFIRSLISYFSMSESKPLPNTFGVALIVVDLATLEGSGPSATASSGTMLLPLACWKYSWYAMLPANFSSDKETREENV